MADRRWDDDQRGDGVADAAGFLAGAEELIAAMRRPNWVAEEPEVLGGIVEPAGYIRQWRTRAHEDTGGTLTFDVVTGIVDEVPFKPHGHTLRLSIAAAP
jgi:hypothetical protein